MAHFGVIFSFRDASCWRVEVINGAGGVRFFLRPLDTLDGKGLTLDIVNDLLHLLLRMQLPLLILAVIVADGGFRYG